MAASYRRAQRVACLPSRPSLPGAPGSSSRRARAGSLRAPAMAKFDGPSADDRRRPARYGYVKYVVVVSTGILRIRPRMDPRRGPPAGPPASRRSQQMGTAGRPASDGRPDEPRFQPHFVTAACGRAHRGARPMAGDTAHASRPDSYWDRRREAPDSCCGVSWAGPSEGEPEQRTAWCRGRGAEREKKKKEEKESRE